LIHLLQPLWLGAMAAIAAPVILHFWNDRRGKVLRIGSISLLMGASQQMAWSRRLSQWLLLLLRCLLLVLLAVLLAGPYWRQRADRKKGWVIVGEEGLAVDSLVKAGWERHVMSDSENYWNGFRAADSTAPARVPFYLVTTGLAARFSGERPSTDREVHWDTYTPADSVRHWIRAAWLSGPDSVWVLRGLSRSTGTNYSGETVAMNSRQPVAVDTSVLRVVVYSDPAFLQDGRYVTAALRALQQYTGRRMEIEETGRPPERADWLFWLSTRPLPAGAFAHVSRFDPDWNEMVWKGSLPVVMEKLLYGEDTNVAEDRRVIDPAQILPAHGGGGRDAGLPGESKAAVDPGINLAPVVWWLILLLFIIERLVSHEKRKT